MTKSNTLPGKFTGAFTIVDVKHGETLFHADNNPDDLKILNDMLIGNITYGDDEFADELSETIVDSIMYRVQMHVHADNVLTMLAIASRIFFALRGAVTRGWLTADTAAGLVNFTNSEIEHDYSSEDAFKLMQRVVLLGVIEPSALPDC
jgi:hypothetical protein